MHSRVADAARTEPSPNRRVEKFGAVEQPNGVLPVGTTYDQDPTILKRDS